MRLTNVAASDMHLEPAILDAFSFQCPNSRLGWQPQCPTLQQWRYEHDYIKTFWTFHTNGLPLEKWFRWAESVRVTRDSWRSGVSTSFQGAFVDKGDAELSASVTAAIEDVLRDSTVEVVYHCTCSAKHTALALMCQKCKFTTQIQIGQVSNVPFDKLQVVRRSLACWLGIVAPASAVDGA